MGPSRHTTLSDPSSSKHPASAPKKKSAKRPHHKKHPHSAPSASSSSATSNPNAVPGVQKIKAALRQTRRLLGKDSLAADVRIATQRRLKSLETDLAHAEQARVERTLATRYHRVKFFERQKVLRKLAQVKRQLDGEAGEEGREVLGKKEWRKLEKREVAYPLNDAYRPDLARWVCTCPAFSISPASIAGTTYLVNCKLIT